MKRLPGLGVGVGAGGATVLCVAMAMPVWAQSCDLQVRDGSAAADIGRIHRCLNDRLNRLESRMDGAGAVSQALGSPRRDNAEFDAGSFAVSATTAKRGSGNVSVSISIRNKSTQDIYVAADESRGQHLLDESSAQTVRAQAPKTIEYILNLGWHDKRQESYSLIPAGSRFSFTFNFKSVSGATGALTMNFLQFASQGQPGRRVTVPLTVSIRD